MLTAKQARDLSNKALDFESYLDNVLRIIEREAKQGKFAAFIDPPHAAEQCRNYAQLLEVLGSNGYTILENEVGARISW